MFATAHLSTKLLTSEGNHMVNAFVIMIYIFPIKNKYVIEIKYLSILSDKL